KNNCFKSLASIRGYLRFKLSIIMNAATPLKTTTKIPPSISKQFHIAQAWRPIFKSHKTKNLLWQNISDRDNWSMRPACATEQSGKQFYIFISRKCYEV